MARAPVTVRGEQTRRRLLEAAEEVFGELGFRRASIAEIVRRAGVAQGTFYLYFDSKEESSGSWGSAEPRSLRSSGAPGWPKAPFTSISIPKRRSSALWSAI
jgi:hypothetical protein